ncbi:MAG: hypothetical protein ABIX37_05625 [Gammaproteobacteria bacterium]
MRAAERVTRAVHIGALVQDGLSVDAARMSRLLLRLPPAGELQEAFLRGRGDADAYLQCPPVALKVC